MEKNLNAGIDAGDKSLNAGIDNVEKIDEIDDANEYFDPFWIVIIIIVNYTPANLDYSQARGLQSLETRLSSYS